jgi:hypothetical protein
MPFAPGEHWRHMFITQAPPPGRPVQSALAPHSRHVFAPVKTQVGVGSAHCVLSRHCTQVLFVASQMGSPGATQSVSAPHCSHVVPTQTGPPAFPAQCVLFWHCTHIMVVTLQARLLVCVAQSASEAQRT